MRQKIPAMVRTLTEPAQAAFSAFGGANTRGDSMLVPAPQTNERERLSALHRVIALDTLPEDAFDALALRAAEICETSVAMISLVDEHRWWPRNRARPEIFSHDRDISFCAHAILVDDLFEIPDTLRDPRFRDNPWVTGTEAIRFYAAAPLRTIDGYRIGNLFVIDQVPRSLSGHQRTALMRLAKEVMQRMEPRGPDPTAPSRFDPTTPMPRELLNTVVDTLPMGVYTQRIAAHAGTGVMFWNRAAAEMLELAPSGGTGEAGEAHSTRAEITSALATLKNQVTETKATVVLALQPGRSAGGEPRMLRLTSLPVFDHDGDVEFAVGMVEDVTAQKQVEASLYKGTCTDRLTGLPNRTHFFELLEFSLARSKRQRSKLAVMALDIDGFHRINESLGGAAADKILQQFATRLRSVLRVSDAVARFGGDEFVIILEGLHDADEAAAVASKLLQALSLPWHVHGKSVRLTTSAGVAFAETPDHTSAAMIVYADELVHAAKSAGGNTFRIAAC
jgi:diguanylate cyclase (GGDEF)-like protein